LTIPGRAKAVGSGYHKEDMKAEAIKNHPMGGFIKEGKFLIEF
jgi:hypothetical protein